MAGSRKVRRTKPKKRVKRKVKRRPVRGSRPKCKAKDCDKAADAARGLCHTHYKFCQRLVNAGETTWELLEQKGIVRPLQRKRIAQSAFAKAVMS